MKILISGAYGFVGTNLSKYLADKGHECVALDIANGGLPAYSAFYTWDDLDKIDWTGIDAVVHLAGKAHDTKNVTKPQVYFDVNVGLTQKLFTACGDKVKNFIYFSSIKAVDGDTPYAQSKREAEKWLNGRAGSNRSPSSRSVRSRCSSPSRRVPAASPFCPCTNFIRRRASFPPC